MGAFNTVVLCIAGPLLALSGLASVIAILAAAGSGVWFLFAGASLELPGGTGDRGAVRVGPDQRRDFARRTPRAGRESGA